jgi:hypothetical protein
MELLDKVKIELDKTEARRINEGLRYLLDTHLKCTESVANTPQESLKGISCLIVFQKNIEKTIH